MDHLEDLNLKFHSLVVFRNLLSDGVLSKLPPLLSMAGKSAVDQLSDYSCFVSRLFHESENLTEYLWNCVSSNENLYVLKRARGEAVDPILERCLTNELEILEEISHLPALEIKCAIGYKGYLPEWKTSQVSFAKEYGRMICHIATSGYGAFARHRMFSVVRAEIVPVESPDPVRLSDLKKYERERQAVVDNTRALLGGRPAANALLYGDAGTGKSSTIKAIVNEFAPQGLRLIEIRKNQLLDIPAVMESLHHNPLKFILFIDDLSFAQNNEEIGTLKAVLEGTAAAKASNIAVYATSNRRHIVGEKFSDRGDDEIHRNETIQEQISLSQRFGLNVSFLKPDKAKYLEIVREIAIQFELRDPENLDLLAERYALERGGRSPRVARQFVEQMKSSER